MLLNLCTAPLHILLRYLSIITRKLLIYIHFKTCQQFFLTLTIAPKLLILLIILLDANDLQHRDLFLLVLPYTD